jgi:hypothetical protein
VSLIAGQTQLFTPNVTNADTNAVTWSIPQGAPVDPSGQDVLLLVDTTDRMNPVVTSYPVYAPIIAMSPATFSTPPTASVSLNTAKRRRSARSCAAAEARAVSRFDRLVNGGFSEGTAAVGASSMERSLNRSRISAYWEPHLRSMDGEPISPVRGR